MQSIWHLIRTHLMLPTFISRKTGNLKLLVMFFSILVLGVVGLVTGHGFYLLYLKAIILTATIL